MSKVTLLLQGKNIPYKTQSKIKRYLEFVWKQELKEDPDHENFIMNKLSSELRNEIYLHTNVGYLKQVPVFKSFGEKTLTALAQHMKKVCYCPEEVVFKVFI